MPRTSADAITRAEAAAILGVSEAVVARLRREGLLGRRRRYPSYSRAGVEAYVADPWLTSVQAAGILGVGHTRVTQLADAELIPFRVLPSGRRVFRKSQIEVVANARRVRFPKGI